MSKLHNLIQNLKKANQRLNEATKTNPTQMNKDATIQRFEFTFELAWKTMQEYIRDQGIDCKSPKSSIREAAKLDIIDNLEKWFEFLDNRNLIAHTYDEKTANSIYRKALKFPQAVDQFLKEIS